MGGPLSYLMMYVCMIGCAFGNIAQYADHGGHSYPQAAGPHLRGNTLGHAQVQGILEGTSQQALPEGFTIRLPNQNSINQGFITWLSHSAGDMSENYSGSILETSSQQSSKQNQLPKSSIISIVPNYDQNQGLYATLLSEIELANITPVPREFIRTQRETNQRDIEIQTVNPFHINGENQPQRNNNFNLRFLQGNGNQNVDQEFKTKVFQQTELSDDGRTLTNINTQINSVNQIPSNQESTGLIGDGNTLNVQPFNNPSSNFRISSDDSRQLSSLVTRQQNLILNNAQRIQPGSSVHNNQRQTFNTVSQPINNQNLIQKSNQGGRLANQINIQNKNQTHHMAAGPHLRGGSSSSRLHSGNKNLENNQITFSSNTNIGNHQARVQSVQQNRNQIPNNIGTNKGVQDSVQLNSGFLQINRNDINPEVIRRQRQTSRGAIRGPSFNQLIRNQQRVARQSVNQRQKQGNTVRRQFNQRINQDSLRQLNSLAAQHRRVRRVNQISNQPRNQGYTRQLNNQIRLNPRLQQTAQPNLNNQRQLQSGLISPAIQSGNVILVQKDSLPDVVGILPVTDNFLRNAPIFSAVQGAVPSQPGSNLVGGQRVTNTRVGNRNQQSRPAPIQSNIDQSKLRGNTLGNTQDVEGNNAKQQSLPRIDQDVVNVEDIRDGPHSDGSYYFRITNSDGTVREEGAVALDPCTIRVTGSYQYRAPNGEIVTTQFISDQNGYQSFPAGTRDDYIPPVRQPIAPPMMMGPMPPCPSGKYQGGNGGAGTNNGGQGNRPTATVIPTQPPRPRPVIPPQPTRPIAQTPRPIVSIRPQTPRPIVSVRPQPQPTRPVVQTPRPIVPVRPQPQPTRPFVQTPRPIVPVRPQLTPGGNPPVNPPTRPTIANINTQNNDNSNIPAGTGIITNINTQNNDNSNIQPGANIININTQNNERQQGFGNNRLFNFNSQNNNNG